MIHDRVSPFLGTTDHNETMPSSIDRDSPDQRQSNTEFESFYRQITESALSDDGERESPEREKYSGNSVLF